MKIRIQSGYSHLRFIICESGPRGETGAAGESGRDGVDVRTGLYISTLILGTFTWNVNIVYSLCQIDRYTFDLAPLTSSLVSVSLSIKPSGWCEN